MKKLFTLIVLCHLTCLVHAQYVTYEPLPYVPPLPVELPVFTMPEFRQPPRTFIYTEPKPVIKTYNAYLIQVAKLNGQDYSQRYINGNAGIIIYSFENDPKTFMNVVIPGESSKSYGYMLAEHREDTPAVGSNYSRTLIEFAWEFNNSYDNKKGSATCTFIREYRPDGTKFGLLIQDSNGGKTEFYGTAILLNN